jgi:signal peptide peptidase SppA
MQRYPHIAARIFNCPLLISADKLDAIIYGLGYRFGVAPPPMIPQMYDSLPGEKRKPGYRKHGSVGVIDVFGIMTHRGSFDMNTSESLIGYQDIARMLDGAMRDSDIEGIVMNYDTPGGEVDGAFQLAEQIRRAATVKPIRSVIDGSGTSAGYLLAAAARDVTMTTTSITGSIGVVMRHVDYSKALAADGVNVTYIYAGAHKVDGNPFQALPEAVRADLQGKIDNVYGQFVSAIASYRNLDAAKVRGTEARTYMAADAKAAGLINQIGTLDDVVRSMNAATRGRGRAALQSPNQEQTMSKETFDNMFTKADLDKAVATALAEQSAKLQADHAAASKAHGAEVLKAERARVAGILGHAEAKDRRAQAITIATTTEMSVDSAGALLAASPKEVAPTAAQASLQKAGNVIVGADAGGDQKSLADEYAAGARAIAAVTGRKVN